MLAINQRLLFGPILRAKSLLKAGTVLLVPDATAELHSTVTKYLGFFDADDMQSEMWEATDANGQIYRLSASAVYQGMGYSTDPGRAHMGKRVMRCFEHGVESDGVVVGRMAAAEETAEEPEVWLVAHTDGDREDLEEPELKEAIALAKQHCRSKKKASAAPEQLVSKLSGIQVPIQSRVVRRWRG